MKRIVLMAVACVCSVCLYGQGPYGDFPLSEFKRKSHVHVKNVVLPEFEIKDSSMIDLLAEFIEYDRLNNHYHDNEGYIMLCKESPYCTSTPESWMLMSIYPNFYKNSFYGHGSFDGVVYLHGFTFILSLGGRASNPFVLTKRRRKVEFLELIPNSDDWFIAYAQSIDGPDPVECGYQAWLVDYVNGHYEQCECDWGKVVKNSR